MPRVRCEHWRSDRFYRQLSIIVEARTFDQQKEQTVPEQSVLGGNFEEQDESPSTGRMVKAGGRSRSFPSSVNWELADAEAIFDLPKDKPQTFRLNESYLER